MKRLTGAEIRAMLEPLQGWRRRGRRIAKVWRFRTYLEGIRFVDRVARLAEAQNHHPDITIGWRRVRLSLTTHDAGGLTGRDFRLARAIDREIR
jgi:4a-hydroxytetrahydrobiopterin dehydratase